MIDAKSERSLLYGILQRAILDALGAYIPGDYHGRGKQSARDWLNDWQSTDDHDITTLSGICEFLDLNAHEISKNVQKLIDDGVVIQNSNVKCMIVLEEYIHRMDYDEPYNSFDDIRYENEG